MHANTQCAKKHYKPGNHMLATSKSTVFPGHNHLLTAGTGAQVIIKVTGHQYQRLAGYDLEIGHVRCG